MYQTFKRKERGTTFIELLIGMTILALILGFLARWFFMQKEYQKRLTRISDIQNDFRRASWEMIQEIQMARTIIWPRINADNSLRSDTKVVFKDFTGRIISYYHVPGTKEVRRCVIPNGPGDPVVNPVPIGRGIATMTFTASSPANKLISYCMSTDGIFSLDAVYLINSD